VRGDLLEVHPDARERVHVVAHGFDPRPWEVDARPPEGVRRDGFALLVGTGSGAGGPRKKGVDVLLRAFATSAPADLDLVVVGPTPGLPPRVRVLPEIDDEALAHVVAAARVLVVPSRSEGFGYPMLEAFAAGVPVVASAAGALPEVSGGAARLVPPGDADALAEAIARVATDEELRARLIAAGKKRAREFPVEAMARGWLKVLCEAGGLPCPV
jgi:glycosyltransferase involved in cell wall biosynthesis